MPAFGRLSTGLQRRLGGRVWGGHLTAGRAGWKGCASGLSSLMEVGLKNRVVMAKRAVW